MKTKLTLKYSSFFFCNSIQLKKGQETEVETDSLSNKDLTILNAYITSGGITSSEGLIPLVIEDVKIILEDEPQVVEDKEEKPLEEEVTEPEQKEQEDVAEEETPVKKTTTKRTTKKTK
jgi:hypothetical protein